MKKKSLILVLVLLCLSSLMVAMAYTSAEVQAGYTVKVAASNKALLALAPHSNNGKTAYIDDQGNLVLDFGRVGDDKFGLQPDGTYTWKNLVDVINNTENKIKVTFVVVDESGVEVDYLKIIESGGGEHGTIIEKLILEGKSKEFIGFSIVVPSDASVGQNLEGRIIVTAEVVD